MKSRTFKEKILTVDSNKFEELALDVFRFQYEHNSIYRQYADYMGASPKHVTRMANIPFLPIELFKTHIIQSVQSSHQHIFESSGTTQSTTSKHYIVDLPWYTQVSENSFTHLIGAVEEYCVLGLLPSYLERNNSSLVYMVNHFISKSKYSSSAFFLDKLELLDNQLKKNEAKQIPTLLIGVTFALLEFAEQFPRPLQHTIVMETGGMKGRRKELVRTEIHDRIKRAFQLNTVFSEYGMTELLSQAYSKGNGKYQAPPWMRIIIKELNDPRSAPLINQTGLVNIIDLANVDSCSFIQTSDLGKMDQAGFFEILGRLDSSDLRGCNLMVTN